MMPPQSCPKSSMTSPSSHYNNYNNIDRNISSNRNLNSNNISKFNTSQKASYNLSNKSNNASNYDNLYPEDDDVQMLEILENFDLESVCKKTDLHPVSFRDACTLTLCPYSSLQLWRPHWGIFTETRTARLSLGQMLGKVG